MENNIINNEIHQDIDNIERETILKIENLSKLYGSEKNRALKLKNKV